MKLRSDLDKRLIELEMGVDNPTTVQLDEFIKKRRGRVKKMVDFRKSQNAKANWRKNRFKMMRSIKKWHKSTEGKRFHRQLGRFLATRLRENYYDESEKYEILKAVSSLRTHLYLEGEYMMPIEEQIDFDLMMEYAIPLITNVELNILNNVQELSENELELLLRLSEVDQVLTNLNALSPLGESTLDDLDEDSTYGYLESFYKLIGNDQGILRLNQLMEQSDG